MPLTFEENEDDRASREADEAADQLFEQRVRAAAEHAALNRRRQAEEIRRAQELLDRADPQLLAEERYRKAVAGCDLLAQRASPPSLGGLTAQQMQQVAREEKAKEQAWKNERNARERWVASQEEVIEKLSAGQSEDNKRLIRQQFYAQRRS
jgi:hypothetical protein